MLVIISLRDLYYDPTTLVSWLLLNSFQGWGFYISSPEAFDSVQQLREWLADNYRRMNIRGLIILGHTDLYAISEISHISYELYPMDLYLMDLDGEYVDSDNNSYIDRVYDPDGEGPRDIYPEIFLGRIHPHSKYDQSLIFYVLNKSISVLLGRVPIMYNACAFIDDVGTASTYAYHIYSAYNLLYNTTLVNGSEETTASTYLSFLSKKWGLFMHFIHGSQWYISIYHNGAYETVDTADVKTHGMGGQINILVSCLVGDYTFIGEYFAEAFLELPMTISVIASTKVGFALMYRQKFLADLYLGYCVGEAFIDQFSKTIGFWANDQEYPINVGVWGGLTLLGDPLFSLDIHPVDPSDTDKDGIVDLLEGIIGSSPTTSDTDNDGISDVLEILFNLKVNVSDANEDYDGDGLANKEEIELGINPRFSDSDFGGIPDGWEVEHNLNPDEKVDDTRDYDNDGLNNYQEYLYNMDPWDNDTDDDGISDLDEVNMSTTHTPETTQQGGIKTSETSIATHLWTQTSMIAVAVVISIVILVVMRKLRKVSTDH